MDPSQPLHTQAIGPGQASTIVLIHGGGVSGWMWRPVISYLPEYHILVPDLPEQGGSVDVGPFTLRFAARKVAETIRLWAHGGRAHVVGLSAGAQTLVQLLADSPELVDHAVVSSALMRPVSGLGWAGSPRLLAWAYKLSIAPFRNWEWWIRTNMKYSANVPDEFYPDFKRDFQNMTESGFVNLMVENQRFRTPPGLEQVDVPTLAVAGEKEYSAMKQSMRDLAAALPRARAVELDLGRKTTMAQEHNWPMTAPELFARTVRAWVEDQPLPAELKPMELEH
jgi:pimeloyl-ACP methyl ester carboxylesterase